MKLIKHFTTRTAERLGRAIQQTTGNPIFVLFERAAEVLQWPKAVWPLLLQIVLTGKAQDAQASMIAADSMDCEKVKAAVLRAYELVLVAYSQKFRNLRKTGIRTYVDFNHEEEILFDRWCMSVGATTYEKLCDLKLLEEFKSCLPDRMATYMNELKLLKASDAAIRADEHVLTHKKHLIHMPPLSAYTLCLKNLRLHLEVARNMCPGEPRKPWSV